MTFRIPPAALAAMAMFGIAGVANADVTVIYTTNVDSSDLRQAMKKATPEQRKMMAAQGYGKPRTIKTYVRGGAARTDIDANSTIINVTEHKAIKLDTKARMYEGEEYKPTPPPPGAPLPHVTVTDTGKTKQFLGHPVKIYTLSVTPQKGPGSMTGEIWAASDIPKPPFDPLTNNPSSPLAAQMKKITGLTLKVSLQMKTPNGTNSMTQVATSISAKPLPASEFEVPSGYKKFTPPPPQQQQPMQPAPHK